MTTEARRNPVGTMQNHKSVDLDTERACTAFLLQEAEYLDDRRFGDWLGMIDPEIDYTAPVRTSRENWDGDGISKTAFYLEEDYPSIEMRVKRLGSRYAWSESPATRTRRMVGNIRFGGWSDDGARVAVRSNVAIFCHRGDAPHPHILTAERFDSLRVSDGAVSLVKRVAVLDTAVLGLESLSIFL